MTHKHSPVTALRNAAQPLDGGAHDYDALLDCIGDARFVLLGEATHGTHEFYRERARITRRLISERGFDAVAIEADWPDAHRVDRFVKGRLGDDDAALSLASFERFPTWMWRNADFLDFVGWLREHNDARPPEAGKVGIYGLDLYSLQRSIAAILAFLDRVDPEAAARARERYGCFGKFGDDLTSYAYGLGIAESCEGDALQQLLEVRQKTLEQATKPGTTDPDELFYVTQNALLVRNAERYYRCMLHGSVATWNIRDRHMADTLSEIAQHVDHLTGRPSKIVVWAHNSHVGDARATQLGERGELNVGQLVRERYDRDAFLVGFTTYDGTVTAATDWDGPAERFALRPALPDSYEELLHAAEIPRFALLPDRARRLPGALMNERLERAVGVVYRPRTERASHCFRARLAHQFDAVLHFDRTRAVEPLERFAPERGPDAPETFPFAV
ncbi:MAG: erythromycin esterase family protein [Labilithrix sp.]|nr:erythromycin esterase family protein [Labilithrix sp.]